MSFDEVEKRFYVHLKCRPGTKFVPAHPEQRLRCEHDGRWYGQVSACYNGQFQLFRSRESCRLDYFCKLNAAPLSSAPLNNFLALHLLDAKNVTTQFRES